MQKFFAFALCAGIACVLAVIYTLLAVEWKEPAGEAKSPPAREAVLGDLRPGQAR